MGPDNPRDDASLHDWEHCTTVERRVVGVPGGDISALMSTGNSLRMMSLVSHGPAGLIRDTLIDAS